MDLMNLLQSAGANDSLGRIAGSMGIGESQAQSLVGALAPALMGSLQKQTAQSGGLEALQGALASGDHGRYLEQPELMQAAATRDDGNKILGHLFGSKEVSRNVAAQAAAETGIDAGLIKKALPLVAGLTMGALSKSGPSNDLGGLLGAFGGSDGLIGLAKKLF